VPRRGTHTICATAYDAQVSSEDTRYFTPAEAEALLPEIDRLLATAQGLLARLDQLHPPRSRGVAVNGQVLRGDERVDQPADEQQTIQAQLQAIAEQIHAQGVTLRDIRTGLIDFPALRDGQEIFLCWQRGEPLRLAWWHPFSTGIAGRQRL